MRPTVTHLLRRATHLQSIPPALVEWTSILLILLVVTLCTFSGDLQLMTRANPSQTSVTAGLGCIRFKRHNPTRCTRHGTRTCIQFNTHGHCKHFTNVPGVGACLRWDPQRGDACIEWATDATAQCSGGGGPDSSGICSDGSAPTCSSGVPDLSFPGACITYSLTTITSFAGSNPSTTSSTGGNPSTTSSTGGNPSTTSSTGSTTSSGSSTGSTTSTTSSTGSTTSSGSSTGSTTSTTSSTGSTTSSGSSTGSTTFTTSSTGSTTSSANSTGSATSSGSSTGNTTSSVSSAGCDIVQVLNSSSVGNCSSSSSLASLAAQCPAGPTSPAGIIVSYNAGAPQGQQCSYSVSSGAQCTTSYMLQGTTLCVAPPNASCPAAAGATPVPTGAICTYTPPAGQPCASGYVSQGTQCVANTTFNSGPASVCPAINGNPTTPGTNGQCTATVNGQSSSIGPTCPQGYVYISSGCLANPIADLVDTTSGNCTTDNPTLPTPNYTCPYATSTLTCLIATTGTLANTGENCTITQNINPTTILSTYNCTGLDPNYTPQSCSYYGTNTSGTRVALGASTCSLVSTGTSAMVDCQITTCMDGSDTLAVCPSSDPLGTNPSDSHHIIVQIDQQCTQVATNQPLTCIYGNGQPPNPGTSVTTKTKLISVNCSGTFPNQSCTTGDNYGLNITKTCSAPAGQGQGSPAPCKIYNGNDNTGTLLWTETCSLSNNSSYPQCTIKDTTGNVPLGQVQCSLTLSCTITDQSGNSMTLTCTSLAAGGGYQCTSSTPDCPHTDQPPFGANAATTSVAVTESSLACDGALVVDLFGGVGSQSSPNVTLIFPLSQAELEFILQTNQLGVGSQSWASSTSPIAPGLPQVMYL